MVGDYLRTKRSASILGPSVDAASMKTPTVFEFAKEIVDSIDLAVYIRSSLWIIVPVTIVALILQRYIGSPLLRRGLISLCVALCFAPSILPVHAGIVAPGVIVLVVSGITGGSGTLRLLTLGSMVFVWLMTFLLWTLADWARRRWGNGARESSNKG